MAEKIQADLVLRLINPCGKLGRKAGTSAGRKAAEVMTKPRNRGWAGEGRQEETRTKKQQQLKMAVTETG